MKKGEEKDPVDLNKAPSEKALTRRQAIKRIAMGGMGIAGIVLFSGIANASKHCCIDAYPDYNYQDYGGGGYSSYGYSSYGYSSYNDYYSSHNSYYSNNFAPGPGFYASYNAYSSMNYR